MPPEQISGQEVSRAADIYAASVVLWEALTSSRLFAGSNDGEVVYRVMEGQVAAPSSMRPEIPPLLEQIVLKGLSRDPAARFATAKEMAEMLERSVPPVTRSAIGTWVRDCAKNEIAQREECVARVEGTMTPVPASLVPPAPANGDSTLSRMGSLSQSVTPEPPSQRFSPRKRQLAAVAVALSVVLLALTPAVLRSSPVATGEPVAAAAPAPAAPERGAPEPQGKKPGQSISTVPTPPAAPPTAVASAEPETAASTASAPADPPRRRATAASSKRPSKKGGSFDRIYRRD
jgi:serine/threonine-protein kinase